MDKKSQKEEKIESGVRDVDGEDNRNRGRGEYGGATRG